MVRTQPMAGEQRPDHAFADDRALIGWQSLLLAIGIALIFGLVAYQSIELTRQSERIAPLWLANSLVLVALLKIRGAKPAPTLLLSMAVNFAVNLAVGDRPFAAFGLAVANAFEIALAHVLVKRARGQNADLTDIRQLRDILVGCALLAPASSGLIAALVLDWNTPTELAATWLRWTVTDGLGMLLVIPNALILTRESLSIWWGKRHPSVTALIFLGGLALIFAVFWQQQMPLLFLVSPVVIAHAWIDGLPGTALSTIKVAIVSAVAYAAGFGPIMMIEDPWLRIVVQQLFLVTLSLSSIPLAVAINSQRRAVRSLALREIELVEQTRRAEQAVQAKSQFLANMSHELRTPMNGVLGFAEMLADDAADPVQRKRAELIVESGESMMRLLNDVLDIAKVEAGSLVIERHRIPIEHLAQRCISLNQAIAARKGLKLCLWIDPALPDAIVSDSQRIQQILLNLLGNAIKFTEQGWITLAVHRCKDRIRFCITDTGIGIPATKLDTIFQRFEQADNSTTRNFGGTGLGLAISRHIAERLGGSLTVASTDGVGSEFTLELPLESASRQRASRAEVSFRPSAKLPRCRVLLAEDHLVNQALMQDMLGSLGQDLVIVGDGLDAVDAVEQAEAEGKGFDLVLMDAQMPRCDGYDATRRIRALGIGPDRLPIVALTANAFADDIDRAHRVGMQEHLAKPISASTLLSVLQRHAIGRGSDPGAKHKEQKSADARGRHCTSARAKELWTKSRSDTLSAVQGFLDGDKVNGPSSVAALAHKVAGTAAYFGEAQLGELARKLESHLLSGGDRAAAVTAARQFLVAASAHFDAA